MSQVRFQLSVKPVCTDWRLFLFFFCKYLLVWPRTSNGPYGLVPISIHFPFTTFQWHYMRQVCTQPDLLVPYCPTRCWNQYWVEIFNLGHRWVEIQGKQLIKEGTRLLLGKRLGHVYLIYPTTNSSCEGQHINLAQLHAAWHIPTFNSFFYFWRIYSHAFLIRHYIRYDGY